MNIDKIIEIKNYLVNKGVDLNNIIVEEYKNKRYIKISIGLEFFLAKGSFKDIQDMEKRIASQINNYFDFSVKGNKVLITIKEENIFKLFSEEKVKN